MTPNNIGIGVCTSPVDLHATPDHFVVRILPAGQGVINITVGISSLSMHINMHYTPSTTHSTAFHNPPMHTTNASGKMAQDVGMV